MPEMTGLERIRAAVAHESSDMVPWHPYVSPGHALHLMGKTTDAMYTEPGSLPKAMIHACRHYNSDMVYCRNDFYMGYNHDMEWRGDTATFHDKQTGDAVYHIHRDSHNLIPLVERKSEQAYIKDIGEVDEKMPITPAEEMAGSGQAAALRLFKEELGDSVAIFGSAAGVTVKALRYHRGFEQGLMDLHLNPELAEAIMWRRVEQLREHARLYRMLGLHGYYTGDAEASCNVVSPAIWHSLLEPIYKAHMKDIHDNGLISLLHICGKSNDILEGVAQTGARIFESLDPPSLGGDVDLADAKRRVGDRVCLKGNLDAPGVIHPGPADAVYDKCMECMRAAAAGGGYILSTEQVLPATDPEHVFAMRRARREYDGPR